MIKYQNDYVVFAHPFSIDFIIQWLTVLLNSNINTVLDFDAGVKDSLDATQY